MIAHKSPRGAAKESGHWLLITVIIVGLLTAAGIFFSIDGLIVTGACAALLSRLILVIHHFYLLDFKPFYYIGTREGLRVVGIIPGTPAEKMGIYPGEIITKVNDRRFENVEGFYFALQKNMAYCKLEVKDENGEIRFVKGAVHSDDYHNIGLLFLESSERNPYNKAAHSAEDQAIGTEKQ